MKLRARLGTRKDVRHQSADNRTDDPENDRPHKRHVHVHERFRSPPGDQTNDDVPNQMKHDVVSSFEVGIGGYQGNRPENNANFEVRNADCKIDKDANGDSLRPTRPPLQQNASTERGGYRITSSRKLPSLFREIGERYDTQSVAVAINA